MPVTQKSKKLSNQEWRQRLTAKQYAVLREAGTEPPFSGKYVDDKTPGTYSCGACGETLFSSKTKYDSQSGWPSFYDIIRQGAVELREENSVGRTRTEVVCAQCGSHLGHVFDDGPAQTPDGKKATGKRYCINSLALQLEPERKR